MLYLGFFGRKHVIEVYRRTNKIVSGFKFCVFYLSNSASSIFLNFDSTY